MRLMGLALTIVLSGALSGCAVNVVTTPVGSGGASASLSAPTTPTKESCQKDGWKTLRTRDGQSFKNQGACVSYFAKGS